MSISKSRLERMERQAAQLARRHLEGLTDAELEALAGPRNWRDEVIGSLTDAELDGARMGRPARED